MNKSVQRVANVHTRSKVANLNVSISTFGEVLSAYFTEVVSIVANTLGTSSNGGNIGLIGAYHVFYSGENSYTIAIHVQSQGQLYVALSSESQEGDGMVLKDYQIRMNTVFDMKPSILAHYVAAKCKQYVLS